LFLEDIEAALKEVDPVVDYGMVDKSRAETAWNYIVFNRTRLTASTQRTSFGDAFEVHIVRENYVPEDIDTEIIAKLCKLPGVRLAGEGTFDYVQKPNTNIVIEMLTIPFVRARKA
jgi:hypothetical protein